MRLFVMLFLLGLIAVACEVKGVDSSTNKKNTDNKNDTLIPVTEKVETSDTTEKVEKTIEKANDTLVLENGIKIIYFEKGRGERLQKGDVVKIDYRAKLEDGTIFDGNHLVKKPTIPFIVGWNQQTPGWDIAMKELRVGDDVDLFIPAKYARGEKGIEGLIPPNANNIISMRIVEMFEPTVEVDGIKIWKYDELDNPGDSIDFKDEVFINYWVSSESKPRYDNSYKRGEPFRLIMGDGNIIPGLYKALHFAREGDRLMIKIPAKEAYGRSGLKDLIKPNEDLFYDIQVAKVNKREQNQEEIK